MKRFAPILLVTLALAGSAFAQDSSSTAKRIRTSASAPATCAADRGEVYFNTTSDKIFRCTAANTWTEVGGAAASYTVYTALLTQSGTNAPTASVLENTLGGAVTLARSSAGIYTLTLAGAFPDATKVFFVAPLRITDTDLTSDPRIFVEVTDANTVTLKVGGFEAPNDNQLTRYPLEIRVYP